MAALLRSHRRRAGLTLEALAEGTGLTKSYLSKVERGISTPSIAVALKIARALDADVSQLFSDSPDNSMMTVERRGERAQVDERDGSAVYDAVATRMIGKSMQPFIVHPTTQPGSDYMEHPGEEFILVKEGTVEVSIPDQVITLDEGDSLYFDANTPHRVRSVSPSRAVLIVVVHDRDGDSADAGPASKSAQRCAPTAPTSSS
ncbi:DNA-binding protein [Rhodococcus ruber Chol-4]|nr:MULTISPECIES: XRE family transcriptional regulator [Rhodococcus]MDO2377068.1 XRE family transcriptional regulator [Rhodococcus ruber]RIK09145.1 MAG: XRE family transcriptional regulator [Acidobacteriota bacterium]ATQ32045.1 XRE family transcriptional regulator [Rhodococcus ruber]AUM19807.1 XRE family transcriptional regulator [Rhodococcus ruber]AWH01570.1 XRE family transcriptional regulator [Rhodococcus ruber]